MSEAKEFKDRLTGRRVWQATSVGDYNQAFYFHDRGWSRDGQWLYFMSERPTDDDAEGKRLKLYRMHPPDGTPERVKGTTSALRYGLFPDDRCVLEKTDEGLFKVDSVKPGRTKLFPFDEEHDWGNFSVSCDGRRIAGARCTRPVFDVEESDFPDRETYSTSTWLMPDVRVSWLVVIDAETGTSEEITHSRDWYTHVQWSPTDPELISFCHEGNWLLVERTWLIGANGHGLRQVVQTRKRIEGLGHEFFSADGRFMWGHGFRPPKPYSGGRREFDTYSRFIFRQSLDEPGDYREWPEEKVSRHWNVGASPDWILGDGTMEPHYDSAAIWRAWVDLDRDRLEFEPIASTEGQGDDIECNAQVSPDGRWVAWTSRQFSPAPQVCVTEL
jgi:oligogalacturonide lyase